MLLTATKIIILFNIHFKAFAFIIVVNELYKILLENKKESNNYK